MSTDSERLYGGLCYSCSDTRFPFLSRNRLSRDYRIPNDESEQNRLDLLHHIVKLMLGGELLTAPLLSSPKRVLDVGTGTGIWAIEFADQYPESIVVGTDLSPIQPSWVPPNLQFYVEDCEANWSFSDSEKFDYIHGRALCGAIADWPRFYSQAFNNLEPGGWMEMQDHECWINSNDGDMASAPGCNDWVHECDRASRAFGKRLNVAHEHRQWMIDAGFEDVHETIKKVSRRVFLGAALSGFVDSHWPLGKRPEAQGTWKPLSSSNDRVDPLFHTRLLYPRAWLQYRANRGGDGQR